MTWPVIHAVNQGETRNRIEMASSLVGYYVADDTACLHTACFSFELNSQDLEVRFPFVDCKKRDKRSSFSFTLYNYVYI